MYVVIASLKSKQTCKLINGIQGSSLLISCLPGSALRTHFESFDKPRNSTSVVRALLSRAIEQAFWQLSLVNLISKYTHLVCSIYNHGPWGHVTNKDLATTEAQL